jgi:recombination protein RecT
MNDNAVAVVCKSLVDPAMQAKFQQVLPPDVSLDRFTRVTLTAIQNNPAILDCDRGSLYNACVTAAQRGLLPDGKDGALVSFNTKDGNGGWIKKVQFMPMPEGVIKEMAKAGIKAYTVSVYENDEVEIWNDDSGQHFTHKSKVFGGRGERVGAVACGKDSEGRVYVEAMNMDDLARARAASKSPDKGPWQAWPERMEQKTVLHRLRRRVPIIGHDELVERFREDDEAVLADPKDEPPVEQPAATTATVAEQPAKPAKRPKGLQAVIEHAETEQPPPYEEGEVF